MNRESVFVIRSRDGEFMEDFLSNKCVGVGWELNNIETLDMNELRSFENIKKLLYSLNPEKYENNRTLGHVGGQINKFVNIISVGDTILCKSKENTVWVGVVQSEALFLSQDGYHFKLHRVMDWQKQILMSELSEKVKQSFYANSTVFAVDNDYMTDNNLSEWESQISETVGDDDLINPPTQGEFVYCGVSLNHPNYFKIGKANLLSARELSLSKDRTYGTYRLKLDVWVKVKDVDTFERLLHRYFHKFRLCIKNGFGIDTELFHTPNFDLQERFKWFITTNYLQQPEFAEDIIDKNF